MNGRAGQVAGAVAIGLVVAVVMVRLGMAPRLVLVGCIMVLAAAIWLLLADLGPGAVPIVWQRTAETETSPQSDRRVVALRSRVRSAGRRPRSRLVSRGEAEGQDAPFEELVASLVAVIDDHLLADHGIDRSQDPDAAAAVLGDELARFTIDPSAQLAMTRPRSLARTVTLIESLAPSRPRRTTT